MRKKLTAFLAALLMMVVLVSCSSMTAQNADEGSHATVQSQDGSTGETEKKDTDQSETAKKEGGETEEYYLTGTVSETLTIDTDQAVSITLENANAEMSGSVIKIKNADSVTLILKGKNTLISTGEEEKTIKSDVDLTITGDGSLYVESADTCIKSDTNIVVESGVLELHAGVEGDALRSDETLTINGGTITADAGEGLESTQITINDGTISITATDDGVNASQKSETLTPSFTMNGGELTINMGQGDTDAIDSNGTLTVNGGKINITAQFAFDADGEITYTGGEITVNGQKVNSITGSMMGGQGPMGQQGGPWAGNQKPGQGGQRPEHGGQFPGEPPEQGGQFPGEPPEQGGQFPGEPPEQDGQNL